MRARSEACRACRAWTLAPILVFRHRFLGRYRAAQPVRRCSRAALAVSGRARGLRAIEILSFGRTSNDRRRSAISAYRSGRMARAVKAGTERGIPAEVLAAVQNMTKEPIRLIIIPAPMQICAAVTDGYSKAGCRLGALPFLPEKRRGADDTAFDSRTRECPAADDPPFRNVGNDAGISERRMAR